jgi:hypothetical protein
MGLMWWRRQALPEAMPPDPRVPPLENWSEWGIVGTIGSGPHAGGTVVARVMSYEKTGHYAGYYLELPVPNLEDEDGEHIMDDGATDTEAVPGFEAGAVDALTAAVNVAWWTDEQQIAAFWIADGV